MTSRNKCRCLCLGMLFLFGALTCQALQEDDFDMKLKFEQWMSSYDCAYDSSAEKEMRFRIFKDNVAYIESSNSKNKSYKLGINQFTDLTNKEFKATRTRGRTRPNKLVTSFKYDNVTVVPDSIDWRTKGAVTPVKNQGRCGSCWVFSAIACTEGLAQIETDKLVALSEKELVECVSSGHDNCKFGTRGDVFEFMISNRLSSAAGYPYTSTQGTCHQDKSYPPTITGLECVPENDEFVLHRRI